MLIVRIKAKSQVTIPYKILKELDIGEGDFLEAKIENGKIVLVPKMIASDNWLKVIKKRKEKEK